MKASLLIQSPKTVERNSLHAHLVACIRSQKFDFARVAVAYATVSGIRSLLAAFDDHGLKKSRWTIGLDDAITQPGAIDLLLSLKNVQVRVASFESSGRRFHPKFYAFTHVAKDSVISTLIGSANLTADAFFGNSESITLLQSTDQKDKDQVNSAWEQLWAQGHTPTASELKAYARKYEKEAALHQKYRTVTKRQLPKSKSVKVLASDEARIDPSMANTCWIECGNVTAMGRELELKAEQGLFFGLSPSGGESRNIAFQVSDGSIVNLRMKYQNNQMWRLQMNNFVPEVKTGLRPIKEDGKLGRSLYVAVFKRVPAYITLRFIQLSGKKFAALRERTRRSGTIGKTTVREYGWCP